MTAVCEHTLCTLEPHAPEDPHRREVARSPEGWVVDLARYPDAGWEAEGGFSDDKWFEGARGMQSLGRFHRVFAWAHAQAEALNRADPPPGVVLRTPYFGSALRLLREQAGLSLRRAARLIGTTPAWLARIERSEFVPGVQWYSDAARALSEHIVRVGAAERSSA